MYEPEVDRRALIGVATQFFVNGAAFASFVPRLPEIRDMIGIDTRDVGVALFIAGLVGLVGSAVTSRLITMLGTRRVVMIGGVLLSLSLLVVGNANGYVALVVGLALFSTLDVFVDVAMNLQGSWISGRRKHPVMNRLHGLWSLGTLVGGFTASWMANVGVSLRLHSLIVASVLVAAVMLVSRWLLAVDEAVFDEIVDSSNTTIRRPLLLVGLGLAGLFAVVLESTSNDWASFRMTDDFGLSAGAGALGYVAVAVGMTASRFAGDWMVAMIGEIRHLALSLAITFVGLLLATLVSSTGVAFVGFALTGVGIASLLPTIYDRAAKYPGPTGAGLGALTAGIRVALLAAPLAIGSLATSSLTVGAAMAIFALPSVLGFAAVALALGRQGDSRTLL